METQVTPPKIRLNVFHTKTKGALLWMNLSNEPFIVLYALIAFILRKELGASLLQISILSALRPVLPLLSFYWSANFSNEKTWLRLNLALAWALARLPFLLVPWVHTVWYLIFCCAMYELFNKSGIPALIEILKINIPKESREKTYTLYFVISFLESILLGIFIAGILEHYPSSWQMLCCCTALLSLSSILLQMRVPIASKPLQEPSSLDWKQRITKPWKDAFLLLKTRADFAHFQYGFMIGGFGLMFITPSLAFFYVDHLQLSHSDIVIGRSILMGIGVVLSSYFWKNALSKKTVSELTFWVLLGFALYPLFMVFARHHMGWFYLSFIFYGIAQAGSHLIWNLSGTLFAVEEDSSPYSRVNILMLGLRGAIAPALGGFCCDLLGPTCVLTLGAAICTCGVFFMRKKFLVDNQNLY